MLVERLPPGRFARLASLGIAAIWAVFGVRHLLFGQVRSQVPSFGFLATCALSLAAPFFYRRVRHWPRHGYTVLLLVATLFCALLATIDVAMHYLIETKLH